MIKIKVIVNTIDKETLNEIHKYAINLEKLINQKVSLIILDPRYNSDYFILKQNIENSLDFSSNLKVHNLYLQQYFKSKRQNNINELTNDFINGQKLIVENDNVGHRYFKKGENILVDIESDKNGKVNAVEYFHEGFTKTFRRVLVNGHGNVQTIRTFDENSGKAICEEYVDSDLNPFIKIEFNKKGQKESYQLIGWNEQKVDSEIDFNDCWIRREINDDDYVINLNRDFDVLFSTFVDVKKLFLM